jgi:hypothetical protein
MTLSDRLKPGAALSLSAQIAVVERRLSCRQQRIDVHTESLLRQIRQQITTPASLLLACSIGFVIAELTQSQKIADNVEKNTVVETTPLRDALQLISSVRTLYLALPVAWIIKSFT